MPTQELSPDEMRALLEEAEAEGQILDPDKPADPEPPKRKPGRPKKQIEATNVGDLLADQNVVPIADTATKPHPCGLPKELLGSARDRAMLTYVKSYGYSAGDWNKIKRQETGGFTPFERRCYLAYKADRKLRPHAEPSLFVAALRMYKSGKFPLKREGKIALHAIPIMSEND